MFEILEHLPYHNLISQDIFVILKNSVDPDEMPLHEAFHLGLHCLLKYLFASIQNEKG